MVLSQEATSPSGRERNDGWSSVSPWQGLESPRGQTYLGAHLWDSFSTKSITVGRSTLNVRCIITWTEVLG